MEIIYIGLMMALQYIVWGFVAFGTLHLMVRTWKKINEKPKERVDEQSIHANNMDLRLGRFK